MMAPEDLMVIGMALYFGIGCLVMNKLKRPEDDDSLFVVLYLIWPIAVVGELTMRVVAKRAMKKHGEQLRADEEKLAEEPIFWVGE